MLLRQQQIEIEVIAALRAAMPSLQIDTFGLKPASGRFMRLDSFNVLDDDLYKDYETTTHNFTMHAFDAPPGGTRSLKWVEETLARADDVVRSATLAGGRARRQDAQVLFEPTSAEGVSDAHGFIRYSVQIGA